MGTPFVKQFREERESLLFFWPLMSVQVDLLGQKTEVKEKGWQNLVLCLLLPLTEMETKWVFLLFTNHIEIYLPPAKSQETCLADFEKILFHQNENQGTDLNEGLRFINRVLRRRSVVFLLSDFIIAEDEKLIDSGEDLFFKEISSTRKHDLVCGQVFDKKELILPNVGIIELEDAESKEIVTIDTNCSKFVNEYRKLIDGFHEGLQQRLERRGIDHFSFSTDSDFVKILKNFCSEENRRSRQ